MFAWIFKHKSSACVLAYAFSVSCCEAMPNQVIIVRHAERYGDTGYLAGQLNPQGLRRAGALASFLTLSDPDTTNVSVLANGPPTVIFASRPVADGSNNTTRCIQTISTTATTLGLPVHAGFGYGQETALADFILNNPRYDRQNVLICWHHPKIGDLVRAFGYPFNLDPYPHDRFDLVWLMTFPVPPNPLPLVPILQELLFNDPNTLP